MRKRLAQKLHRLAYRLDPGMPQPRYFTIGPTITTTSGTTGTITITSK
jgi:hypothetical protein